MLWISNSEGKKKNVCTSRDVVKLAHLRELQVVSALGWNCPWSIGPWHALPVLNKTPRHLTHSLKAFSTPQTEKKETPSENSTWCCPSLCTQTCQSDCGGETWVSLHSGVLFLLLRPTQKCKGGISDPERELKSELNFCNNLHSPTPKLPNRFSSRSRRRGTKKRYFPLFPKLWDFYVSFLP